MFLRLAFSAFVALLACAGVVQSAQFVVRRHPTSGQIDGDSKAFSCPAAFGQFAHEKYCNLYYECHDYTAYLFTCPYDWLFSDQLRLCDLPDNVNCRGLEISTPGVGGTTEAMTSSVRTTTDASTDPESTTRSTTTTTTTSGPFQCPSVDGLYPNPDDCGSYFNCFGGTGVLQNCPDGLNFNPATQSCDVGDDFCGGGGSGTDDPNGTPRTTVRPFECPPEGGTFPIPSDCSSYYLCDNGNAVVMPCPTGTNFNPNTNTCEEGDSFCQIKKTFQKQDDEASTTEGPEPTPSSWFQCPDLSNAYYVSEYNCSVYFHCTNGLAWQEVCPDGLFFDVALQMCNWADQVNCVAHPTDGFAKSMVQVPEEKLENDGNVVGGAELEGDAEEEQESTDTTLETEGSTTTPGPTPANWFDCPGDGFYANPYNCHEFFNCVFGNAWLMQCSPSNFVFDEDDGRCVPAAQQECREITGIPTPKPTAGGFTVDPDFVCPDDGNFAYDPNCHYYYVCSNGRPLLQQCAANLIFYPPKKRCVNLDEADLSQLTCELKSSSDRLFLELAAELRALHEQHYRQRPIFAASQRRGRRFVPKRAAAKHDGLQRRTRP